MAPLNEKGIHHLNVREVGVDRGDLIFPKTADGSEVFVENLALALGGVMQGKSEPVLAFENVVQLEVQSVTDDDLGPVDYSVDVPGFS
jgi:hypothetical protein